jgi:hypothetical protein
VFPFLFSLSRFGLVGGMVYVVGLCVISVCFCSGSGYGCLLSGRDGGLVCTLPPLWTLVTR